jgi:hypothetical protein
MKIYKILIFQLLPCLLLSAQTDFLINEENTPSTFIQSNPRLFSGSKQGFIIVWEDPRDGGGYYAQRLDNSGRPEGANFPVTSNMNAVFDHETLVVLHEDRYVTYHDWGWVDNDCHYDIYGTKYDAMGNPDGPNLLSPAIMIGCYINWGAFDHTFHYFDNSFILTRLFLGYLWLNRFDADMKIIFEDTVGSIFGGSLIYVMTTAVAGNIGYMMNWLNGEDDNIPFGVYGTYYDAQNNILEDSVLIYDVEFDGKISMLRFPYIRSISIGDSLYQVFYIHPDSLTLTFHKTDIGGIPRGDIQFVTLFDNDEISPTILYDIRNFQLVPLPEGGFTAVISLGVSETGGVELMMYFSEEGEFTGEIQTYTASHRRFEHGVALTGERDFIVTGVNDDDIWLYTYSDFNLSDSIKINDDAIGGAQISPNITLDSDGNYFVSWHDEQYTRGRKVTADGIPSGEQVDLESKNIVFLSDGNIIQQWNRKLDEYTWAVGLSRYDESWNLIREDTLATDETKTGVEGIIASLNDSTLIAYYRERNDVYLRIMSGTGAVIRETIVDGFTSGSPLRIWIENHNSIWLGRGNKFILYSTDFQQMSEILTIPGGIQEYVGQNRFIGIWTQYTIYGEREYYGNVFDSDGSALHTGILLAVDADEIIVRRLGDAHFIVLFSLHSHIYGRVYNIEGTAIADSFMVNEDIVGRRKNPAVAVRGDKVLFAWSDARTPGRGFDIYGRLFSMSDLTTHVEPIDIGIPLTYTLYQNYPNPFNPSTTIGYAIPQAGIVTVVVYDMLGREVAVLLNEHRNPGTYRVIFDAGPLASGVYVYRLRVGGFVDVKRMILVR